MADEITSAVAEAKEMEVKINLSREKYRPVASRGALLFFLLNGLTKASDPTSSTRALCQPPLQLPRAAFAGVSAAACRHGWCILACAGLIAHGGRPATGARVLRV